MTRASTAKPGHDTIIPLRPVLHGAVEAWRKYAKVVYVLSERTPPPKVRFAQKKSWVKALRFFVAFSGLPFSPSSLSSTSPASCEFTSLPSPPYLSSPEKTPRAISLREPRSASAPSGPLSSPGGRISTVASPQPTPTADRRLGEGGIKATPATVRLTTSRQPAILLQRALARQPTDSA